MRIGIFDFLGYINDKQRTSGNKESLKRPATKRIMISPISFKIQSPFVEHLLQCNQDNKNSVNIE